MVTVPAPVTSAFKGVQPACATLVDAGGDLVQVVLVDDAVAGHVAQQPVEVVHGGLAVRELDIDFVIAVGGRGVRVAADAARAEIELDRMVDHGDVDARERDGRLARRPFRSGRTCRPWISGDAVPTELRDLRELAAHWLSDSLKAISR